MLNAYLFLLTVVLLLLLGYALYYWLIVVTEGVFLGRRFVVWLYDLTAERYEAIKQYALIEEQILLVEPLLGELDAAAASSAATLVVDVATGTGRVPFFLHQDGRFHGRVLAIDPSARMLAEARDKLATLAPEKQARVALVQQYAERLPLPTAVADAVTCLEALEFMSDADTAVSELVRVLQPGGVLLLTRRRGREARLFLHRYRSSRDLHQQLTALGMSDINEISWEVDYNLLIARKSYSR